MTKWQEEVLNSSAREIVARAPRQCGKTTTALTWARNQTGKKVAYVSQTRAVADRASSLCHTLFRDEIAVYSRDVVIFKNGTIIYFTRRNQRIDAIVYDDAREQDRLASERSCHRVLIVGSQAREHLIGRVLKETTPRDRHTIVYDYKEFAKESMARYEYFEEMKEMISESSFQEEYGPWEHITNQSKKNRDFLHLLHK